MSYILFIFHGKYEMLAFTRLLIWEDKEEQEKGMTSEEVSTGHFLFSTLKNV